MIRRAMPLALTGTLLLASSAAADTVSGSGLPARRVVEVRVAGASTVREVTDRRGAFSVPVTANGPVVVRIGRLRVRWSPGRVSGTGVRARAVRVRSRTVRTRRGRFSASLPTTGGAVRIGRVRLAFAVAPRPAPPAPARSPAAGAPAPTPAAPAAPAAPSAREPAFPLRAAFYYPWFPEGWDQAGMNPFTHYHPTPGFYSEDDDATIARHLDELAYARVDVAISSWWGPGHYTDRRLPALLARTRAAGSPLRWAAYYEQEGFGDPTADKLTADLGYLRSRVGADPAYLRLGGRFVVLAYGDANDGCAMADRWHRAAAATGAYVVLKVVPGHRACAAQPDGWHQYAPAVRTDSQAGESFAVSPGFWLATDAAPRLGRDVACFRRAVRDMVASRAPWQLVTTFNEWGEGTSVEPAAEWGNAYLDALHDNGSPGAASAPC